VPFNNATNTSQIFGCVQSCSCGSQNVTLLGVTQTIQINTLACCDSKDNCNSATNSSLYTVFCSVSKATLLFVQNKSALTLIATFAMFLI